jgi:hypothetical protein
MEMKFGYLLREKGISVTDVPTHYKKREQLSSKTFSVILLYSPRILAIFLFG